MSSFSSIEWTEATWNPVTGCSHISAGCALLCFERDPAKCHRSILAEVLAGLPGPTVRIEHLGLRVEDAAEGDLFGPARDVPPGT